MKKLPISVIIIAKNEAHNLPRCLDSIKDFASEIIAVINDCTDDSKFILENYKAKIYEHNWQGFVKQKNVAVKYTTFPWVFNIDCDEEVTSEIINDIKNIIEKNKYDAASFCRKTQFMGKWIKHGDWYPDRVIRLFRNGFGEYQGNFLHEKLVIKGKIKRCSSELLHYSFPDLYIFLSKLISFTKNFEYANANKKKLSPFKIIIRSFWKFFRCYFIKLGFLDGYQGLLIAIHQGYSTFFKYSVLLDYELKNSNKKA